MRFERGTGRTCAKLSTNGVRKSCDNELRQEVERRLNFFQHGHWDRLIPDRGHPNSQAQPDPNKEAVRLARMGLAGRWSWVEASGAAAGLLCCTAGLGGNARLLRRATLRLSMWSRVLLPRLVSAATKSCTEIGFAGNTGI